MGQRRRAAEDTSHAVPAGGHPAPPRRTTGPAGTHPRRSGAQAYSSMPSECEKVASRAKCLAAATRPPCAGGGRLHSMPRARSYAAPQPRPSAACGVQAAPQVSAPRMEVAAMQSVLCRQAAGVRPRPLTEPEHGGGQAAPARVEARRVLAQQQGGDVQGRQAAQPHAASWAQRARPHPGGGDDGLRARGARRGEVVCGRGCWRQPMPSLTECRAKGGNTLLAPGTQVRWPGRTRMPAG